MRQFAVILLTFFSDAPLRSVRGQCYSSTQNLLSRFRFRNVMGLKVSDRFYFGGLNEVYRINHKFTPEGSDLRLDRPISGTYQRVQINFLP